MHAPATEAENQHRETDLKCRFFIYDGREGKHFNPQYMAGSTAINTQKVKTI